MRLSTGSPMFHQPEPNARHGQLDTRQPCDASDNARHRPTRRRFAFWLGLGLFQLGEKLHADTFDRLAAAAMRAAEAGTPAAEPATPVHWTAAENNHWRWYERETFVDGFWRPTGITRPINKQTGQPTARTEGYLDDSLVPDPVRFDRYGQRPETAAAEPSGFEHDHGQPSPTRRARHGRPPSRWLRSLKADELRIWLKTIDVPEAGVEGMTYWTHLTRDHSFIPAKIEGLTVDEQAKLHAAAHHGY